MFFIEFLAVGAWGFWLIISLSAIAMSEMTDRDSLGWATITAIATVAFLAFFGNFNPILLVKEYPYDVLMYVAMYFAAGTFWCVIKWYSWLTNIKRKVLDIKAKHSDYSPVDIRRAIRSEGLPTEFPLKVGEYKRLIMGWMILWPASFVWTIINDPVRHVFEFIYNKIGGTMQRISDSVFKDVDVSDPVAPSTPKQNSF